MSFFWRYVSFLGFFWGYISFIFFFFFFFFLGGGGGGGGGEWGGRVLSKFQNDWRNLLSKNIGNILTNRQTIISKDILAQWKFKYSLCAFNSLLVLKILQLISPQFRYKDLKTPYMDLRSLKHFKCLHHLCILIRSIFSILWHPL